MFVELYLWFNWGFTI